MARDTVDLDIEVDRLSPVPLYHQLAAELRRAISDGRLVKGGFLSNELFLAEAWQLSRPTVRRAIQDLVDEGLLVRQRGVGTQIVNDQLRPKVRLASLFDALTAEGRHPSTMVITHERVVADATISSALGVAPGTIVVHLERCRFAGSQRLAVLRDWLTVEAAGSFSTEQLSRSGLYALLRSSGVWPHYALQKIGARSADPTDAGLLDLPVGAPLLTVNIVMQDTSGTRINVGDHVYDAHDYSLETAVVEN
jgi:DNA-binding GntR family transcriptional regulator